ncbi:syringactin [Pseudomonas syringae]|uniref:syringactin n=1 Tax=Pseudomonas syringae TaxID=317 RepID=UPI0034D7131D
MDSKVIVMDISPATIQAGCLGELVPGVEIPVPKNLFNDQGSLVEMDEFSTLLDTVLLDKLKFSSSKEVKIIYVVPSMTSLAVREKILQLSFDNDSYGLTGFFLKPSVSAILFSSARTRNKTSGKEAPNETGLAIRVSKGTSICTVEAANEGHYLTKASSVLDITSQIGSFNPKLDFNSAAIDLLANTIVETILRADVGFRPQLYGNMVLAGGRANELAFYEELKYRIAEKAPKGTLVGMTLDGNPESAAWRGGARYAALFAEKNIFKQQYFESGPGIVHIKCPF